MQRECLNSLLPFGVSSPARLSVRFVVPIYYKNSVRSESSIVVDLIKMYRWQRGDLFPFSYVKLKVSCWKMSKEREEK